MNNKPQTPGLGVVLVSQAAILVLGLAGIWILDVSLPEAKLDAIVASAFGIILAVVTFAIFLAIYRFGGRFAQMLLADLQRVWGLFHGYSWGKIIFVAALAGIGEELLFRGFFQTLMSGYLPIGWAILITSLVFAALHYLSHAYFICAVLMSIVFGVVYYLSGSLVMVMVWHGVYDLIALAVLVKYRYLISAKKAGL
ncbi:CPBP family intramembrane glutamic endopeptidase [Cellvibrio mixtus]|uniref:CPBP family intramembrane glutamic endopeptidase n=1 Tax=Cellvibrio mixtus TaxID=39650 RepID=UPI000587864D|nr:CPBP family intramembrane glutamic endopeptidase [Cellvibrio mixtus]